LVFAAATGRKQCAPLASALLEFAGVLLPLYQSDRAFNSRDIKMAEFTRRHLEAQSRIPTIAAPSCSHNDAAMHVVGWVSNVPASNAQFDLAVGMDPS
jgi:hypothetical protein